MSTSINMTSCLRDPQSALSHAFEQRNLNEFKYALENLHADPNLVDKRLESSLFIKILQTPKSNDFIRICLEYDADCYTHDILGRPPLAHVVGSKCPKNLQQFLQYIHPSKVNTKYQDSNALHWIINDLDDNNFENVSECIKILLNYGVNPNLPDEKSRTPLYLLLKKRLKLSDKTDLLKYFLQQPDINLFTYRQKEMQTMLKQQCPDADFNYEVEKVVDFEYMKNILRNRKELEFNSSFKAFKDAMSNKKLENNDTENDSNKLLECYSSFLEIAVNNGLESTVELLIENGVDVNKLSRNDNQFLKPPAFLACTYGYHKILSLFLKRPELEFYSKSYKQSLLHEVCSNIGTSPLDDKCDYLKCFYLLLNDCRCDVNLKNDIACTPLHYAVRNRNDEAITALLQRGAFIGSKNNFGELAINEINHNVLEDFLDSCITTNDRRAGDEQYEVHIDYDFLKSPKFQKPGGSDEEIEPLNFIDECPDLRYLIKHPVLSSFLYLKWRKLSFLFFANLILFSIFLVCFISFIVFCDSVHDIQIENSQKVEKSSIDTILYVISLIGIFVITVRELVQLLFSWKDYICSFINWCEVLFIVLAWIVLLRGEMADETKRVLRAIVILLAAGEFLLLVGKLPYLSISTYMVILTQVWTTFLKSFALYCIPVIAFAFSFYALFGGKKKSAEDEVKEKEDEDDFNRFGYPGIAIIKTFVMLTGEFEAASLDLDGFGAFYCLIFLLFVFMITIVLFNLLNALAVSDTQIIKADAELADLSQRIKVLAKYEKIIFNRQSDSCILNNILVKECLKVFISIFHSSIPLGRIIIKPNNGHEILIPIPNTTPVSMPADEELQTLCNNNSLQKLSLSRHKSIESKFVKWNCMDRKIMKKVKIVLDERHEKQAAKEEKAHQEKRLKDIESQLKLLTDMIINKL